MILQFSRRELHLAAFVKASGAKLIEYTAGVFIFESDRSEVEFRILHSNSEALQVDRELFTLKSFFNKD